MQDCGGVLPALVTLHHKQGLQAIHRESSLGQEAFAHSTLDGCKLNNALFVMAQQKLHPTVAEKTLGVKNNNHEQSLSDTTRWPL